ncbi:hypothetical protein [uncultured Rikenella sp.]|uniref:hypothetical protein n=1 Tax=uncultured Rikenella sp. TaxID=368003 RepID=UPI0026095CA9|nr:hypothetical protein [uncultured Rikenella sp.]
MDNDYKYNNFIIDLINVLSFAVGLQNIELNNKQIQDLQEHLNNQDKQYEKIIALLEENKTTERS